MQGFAALTFGVVLATAPLETPPADQQPNLRLSVQCVGEDACLYVGKPKLIEITLANESDLPIDIAWEYVRRRGPFIRLTDTETGKRLQMRVSRPPRELQEKWMRLAPHQSIQMTEQIESRSLEHFNKNEVSVNAEVTPQVYYRKQDGEKGAFGNSGTIRIYGTRNGNWPSPK